MREQVLVTGISGFIARHVAVELLRNGFRVKGTLRSLTGADDVRRSLGSFDVDLSGLSFVEADLGGDFGWREAGEGCAYIQHIASPFPMKQPRDRESLVPEARQGALRVMEAARDAHVKRVVVTSSMVAMTYRARRPKKMVVGEHDWTDPHWDKCSAYVVSKTLAEKAVWDWAKKNEWSQRLTVINPGLVLGPALDLKTCTSLNIIKLLMEGAVPGIPRVSYPIVDVRDLAKLYIRAMTIQEAAGRRLIGASDTLSMEEIGRVLRETFPDYAKKIPRMVLPGFLVRLVSIFDHKLKGVIADLGVTPVADNAYVTEMTGVQCRSGEEAVKAAGQSLIDHSVV